MSTGVYKQQEPGVRRSAQQHVTVSDDANHACHMTLLRTCAGAWRNFPAEPQAGVTPATEVSPLATSAF